MASEFALMKAAQAWQTKATSHIWMEPDLAKAFADILDACMVNPSEATQAQLGAPVEDRKVSASDPVSASDQIELRNAKHCCRMGKEENEQLKSDIEAYRGALGYPVSGIHNGLLSNGTRPVCGICAAWRALEEELL